MNVEVDVTVGPSLFRRMVLKQWSLPADADHRTIKARYRQLAKELHPDVGGDHQAFRRLQTQWEYLR